MIETLDEALELQKEIDSKLTKAVRKVTQSATDEAQISMALTGRIKVEYRDGYFNFNREDLSVSYFKFQGDYDDFIDLRNGISKVLATNRADINLLMNSYDNRRNLKETV